MRLMCVVAHPDDECVAFGGALSLASRRGVETYVVCLTDGQAATNRGETTTGEELGRVRAEEFQRSCGVLGVGRQEMWGMGDGRLEFAQFSEVAGELVGRMRAFRPDVVLTFGSDGALNTHADHTMVSLMTTAAFHWAGRAKRYPERGEAFQPGRLFLLSTDRFLEGRQAPLPAPWTVKLDIGEVMEQKMAAFREHRSQAPLMEQTRDFFREHGRWEFYALAARREAGPVERATDLYSGLS